LKPGPFAGIMVGCACRKEAPLNHDILIHLESVTREYQMGEVTVRALRGLDLEVSRGEYLVLLGPSGCGKTTTLNLVGGLDRPTAGRVVVDGEDIVRLDDARLTKFRRDKAGFVFQFFNLIPTLTAAENVEFALALTSGTVESQRRSRELLDLVGLADRADHFPSQLSGGEQQRVAIARALANRPLLLLCDEPTGNLDVETGRKVLKVIRDLNRDKGTTVLLVTHNAAIAPAADRVARLHDGMVQHVESNDRPRPVAELNW
jgi:putative ABC transport system ATP-binding protein